MTILQSKRIEGLDFARALAMFGMLIVNYTVVMGAGSNGPDWLISFAKLFEGRASATFVVLAGIGVALMTRKARENASPVYIKESKIHIMKRSVFLFILGMLMYTTGWTGDILHYYGVYMVIASFFIVTSSRFIILVASLFLILAQSLQVTMNYMKGWHPEQPFMEYVDFWSVEGFFRNLFFNGYHPVFPWVCFFLLGMIIGRLDLWKNSIRNKLFVFSLLLAISTELLSRILFRVSLSVLDIESAEYLFQTGPIPPNIFYIISNSSTALVVIVLSIYIAEKFSNHWFTNAIVKTGQMTLTHYVSHVFIGIGVLIVLNRLENQTLIFSLLFSFFFFAGSILFSVLWGRKFNKGPIELMMRKIT